MKLNRLIERPGIRLFEDGVDELLLGLFLAGYTAVAVSLSRLRTIGPGDTADSPAHSSSPLLPLVFTRCETSCDRRSSSLAADTWRFHKALRNSAGSQQRLWRPLLFQNASIDRTAIAFCLVNAGIWLYAGFRYSVRYYQALGAFAFPATALAWRANLRATVIVIAVGLVSTAIGAVKLWKFAHSHPILTESES